MFWSSDWWWSLPLIISTTVLHVVALGIVTTKSVAILAHAGHGLRLILRFCLVVGAIAFLATILLAIEATMWAATYVAIGALSDDKTALLYSLSAITAYGHAEVFLAPRWQLMGALEALNGIILFGLTTAFLFEAIQAVRSARAK